VPTNSFYDQHAKPGRTLALLCQPCAIKTGGTQPSSDANIAG